MSRPPRRAIKHDTGKTPFNLVPPDALALTALVFGYGACKYARFNWTDGFDWSRLYDSALRHLMAWNGGEDVDPETGYSHLAHAMCCLLMLLAHVMRGLGRDDRGPRCVMPAQASYTSQPQQVSPPTQRSAPDAQSPTPTPIPAVAVEPSADSMVPPPWEPWPTRKHY